VESVGLCACGTIIPPAAPELRIDSDADGGAREALFELHRLWAESIGRSVSRGLPPSFDIDDLKQTAVIEHWHRVLLFEPLLGVPYRAYAYCWIRNAVRMTCRRKHYREATHEELKQGSDARGFVIDPSPNAEATMLRREERRNVSGPRAYRQRAKIRVAMAILPNEDADLVRAVLFAGVDVDALERSAPGSRRRLTRAVGRLRRAVAQ
jgi:hypothetical protein